METRPRNSLCSRIADIAAEHVELAINTLVEIDRNLQRRAVVDLIRTAIQLKNDDAATRR